MYINRKSLLTFLANNTGKPMHLSEVAQVFHTTEQHIKLVIHNLKKDGEKVCIERNCVYIPKESKLTWLVTALAILSTIFSFGSML